MWEGQGTLCVLDLGVLETNSVKVMNRFFSYQLVRSFSIHGDALDLNWFQLCTRVLCSATVR